MGKRKARPPFFRSRPQKPCLGQRQKTRLGKNNESSNVLDTHRTNADSNNLLISKRRTFWSVFQTVFNYPVDSHTLKVSWFLMNSFTFWVIIGYVICQYFFNIPNYNRVPKPILELSGSMLIMAGTIHFMLVVRGLRNRKHITDSLVRLFAVEDTYARIISTTAIIMVFIYAYNVVEHLSSFLKTTLPTLGQRVIGFISSISAFLLSIIGGIISNIVYAQLAGYIRKSRLRKRRKAAKL